MGEKLLEISIQGKSKKWAFITKGDPKYIEEWRNDGLEINVIENMIPEFVVDMGLTRIYCFFQDVINFKNPFR